MTADKVQGALQHFRYTWIVWDFSYTAILLCLLIMFDLPSHKHSLIFNSLNFKS